MVELYGAKYVSLHVRETNYAAFHLYRDTLRFTVHGTEAKYYADGENAFDMRKNITREMLGLPALPERAPKAGMAAAATATGGAGAAAGGAKRERARDGAALELMLGAGGGSRAASAPLSLDDEKTSDSVDAAGADADIAPGAKDVERVISAMADSTLVDLD